MSTATITRDEFTARRPLRAGRLIVPCGLAYGCDHDSCEGWVEVEDDFLDLRPYSEAEINEARRAALAHHR